MVPEAEGERGSLSALLSRTGGLRRRRGHKCGCHAPAIWQELGQGAVGVGVWVGKHLGGVCRCSVLWPVRSQVLPLPKVRLVGLWALGGRAVCGLHGIHRGAAELRALLRAQAGPGPPLRDRQAHLSRRLAPALKHLFGQRGGQEVARLLYVLLQIFQEHGGGRQPLAAVELDPPGPWDRCGWPDAATPLAWPWAIPGGFRGPLQPLGLGSCKRGAG